MNIGAKAIYRSPSKHCAGLAFSLLVHLVLLSMLNSIFKNDGSGGRGLGASVGLQDEGGGQSLRISLVRRQAGTPSASHLQTANDHVLRSELGGGAIVRTDLSETLRRKQSSNEPDSEPILTLQRSAAQQERKVQPPPGSSLQGDRERQGELLRQIARCLPKGMRPVLPLAKLTIDLDQNGNLRAAPQIERYPFMSATDTLMADRIVQAVLQCGPYTGSEDVGYRLSIRTDFSGIDVPSSQAVQ